MQEVLLVQPPTDTESTTLDIGGFSDTSQSLPGLGEGISKKVSSNVPVEWIPSCSVIRFYSTVEAKEGEEKAQA